MSELPPVIMTPEEIEAAEEQSMDALWDQLAELEKKPERKQRRHSDYYSPEQLGELWNLSSDTIRRMFEHEPGVVVIERPGEGRRRHRTQRIPQEVADRVQRRLSNPEKR